MCVKNDMMLTIIYFAFLYNVSILYAFLDIQLKSKVGVISCELICHSKFSHNITEIWKLKGNNLILE